MKSDHLLSTSFWTWSLADSRVVVRSIQCIARFRIPVPAKFLSSDNDTLMKHFDYILRWSNSYESHTEREILNFSTLIGSLNYSMLISFPLNYRTALSVFYCGLKLNLASANVDLLSKLPRCCHTITITITVTVRWTLDVAGPISVLSAWMFSSVSTRQVR